MTTYRIFCMDGLEIIESADVDADDDREALSLLALRAEVADCELWDGDRLVATIKRGENPMWMAAASKRPAN